jgi:hypothetical protein
MAKRVRPRFPLWLWRAAVNRLSFPPRMTARYFISNTALFFIDLYSLFHCPRFPAAQLLVIVGNNGIQSL